MRSQPISASSWVLYYKITVSRLSSWLEFSVTYQSCAKVCCLVNLDDSVSLMRDV
jgi:hypothetical protein